MVIYRCQKYLPQINGFISRLLNLFHRSLCLSLCQYHRFLLFWICTVFWNWEVWVLQLCSSFPRLFSYLGSLLAWFLRRVGYNSNLCSCKGKVLSPRPGFFQDWFFCCCCFFFSKPVALGWELHKCLCFFPSLKSGTWWLERLKVGLSRPPCWLDSET